MLFTPENFATTSLEFCTEISTMTSSTLAHNKSSPPTTASTSLVIKRYASPYPVVNPGSKAENVLAIVEQIVHAPIPEGYRELDEVIKTKSKDPRRAAALAKARMRMATHVEAINQAPSIASLRLKAGLSQAQVAEQLGNSQSGYSLIESGKRGNILLSTFERLVEIFNVSRDELALAIKNTLEKPL